MSDYLYLIHKMYEVRIHAFVLMSNHFHLLISTPQANLSKAMGHFMRETAKEMNRRSGKMNQVYGGRFYRSLITKDAHFAHAYKYVYRNPVTAGVTQKCEAYEYSTLHALLGKSRMVIPLCMDQILFEPENMERVLNWLNRPPQDIDYLTLRKALRKRTLRYPNNEWLTEKHTLELRGY